MDNDLNAETLLDRTYDSLIAGDLTALAALAEEFGTAQPTIAPLDRAGAERLRDKADRNERLLRAAARGVRAAGLRVAELAREPSLVTYDSRGRRASVGQICAEAPKRF